MHMKKFILQDFREGDVYHEKIADMPLYCSDKYLE